MTRVGGDAVTYTQKAGGLPLTIQAVFRRPENVDLSGMEGRGKASVRVEAMIAMVDLAPARPVRGDLIALGSERSWKVETIDQDSTESFYILGLARQD
jgi:hypothetical protein